MHLQCLLVSWYLSVDFQLSILGGILLLLVTKHREIGLSCVVLAFFVSSQNVGTMVFREKYHAILLLWIRWDLYYTLRIKRYAVNKHFNLRYITYRTLNIIKKNEEFYKLYISTSSRVGPYLVGFGAAMLTKTLKERRYNFSGVSSTYQKILLIK